MTVCLVATGPVARAHIVGNTRTLRGLVAHADLVLRAKIAKLTPLSRSSEGPGSRPGVEAEVLDVIKGSFEGTRIHFAQHGHGVAPFEPGEETLLFLVAIERSRELDALGRAGEYAWVSLQEHADRYPLDGPGAAATIEAARAYTDPTPESARRATLRMLVSGDSRLAGSAVRDVVAFPDFALLVREDVPVVEQALADERLSIGVRVALLVEVERRGWIEGGAQWDAWLGPQRPSRERIAVIRAAGGAGAVRLAPRLVALLEDPDPGVVAAAAIALGAPGNRSAVAPLSSILDHDSRQVRMAAIRGLGQIGGPEALAALEAAADHGDESTRRRARAEVRKLR